MENNNNNENKTKIRILSDLHLENCKYDLRYYNEDILILAGDITDKPENFKYGPK